MSDMNNNKVGELRVEPKRLRSSESDLRILVGSGEKEYHYHSQVMASHSKYIDTLLFTPMKESQSLILRFPDISVELWDLTMKYLDPVHSRSLDVETAMSLAPVYDKYEFETGLAVCDDVLANVMKENDVMKGYFTFGSPFSDLKKRPSPDLDTLIDIFLLANAANLQQTMKHGIKYFQDALTTRNCRYGQLMFTEGQIKRLVPMIVQNKLLDVRGFFSAGKPWTDEEILNEMFPDLFVLKCANAAARNALDGSVPTIRMSGSLCNADGEFRCTGSGYRSGRKVPWRENNRNVEHTIFIAKLTDDWVIYGETDPEVDEDGDADWRNTRKRIMWKNPYSANLPLPPKTGWESVDELARGNPELEFIYRENK